MRILVTGGAGFIGSHLCDALLAEGHDVICVDNLQTGSRENIVHLKKNKRFSFIEHDITKPFDPGKVDRIYNLACPASPPQYQKNPIHTMLTNVLGVHHMLALAKQHGARLLQASTSEVYGDPLEHPQKESYRGNVDPTSVRSCYDEGKRAAETLCMDMHRSQGVDVRIARIFNTYGPRMHPDDGRVISTFIRQALKNEPLTVFGKGQQTRSFCYISDNIKGLMLLMESGERQPVNIGNPDEYTILQIAERVKKLTKSSSKIVFKPLPADDPKQRRPDITRANALGWRPTIALDEGLALTIAWMRTTGSFS